MQRYVLGFAHDNDNVALIRKRRPAWQAGKLNGIGGKIEPGESAPDAMRREFTEEAGLHVAYWRTVAYLTGPDWRVTVYAAHVLDLAQRVTTRTDEEIEIVRIADLSRADALTNVAWIFGICRDPDLRHRVVTVTYPGASVHHAGMPDGAISDPEPPCA